MHDGLPAWPDKPLAKQLTKPLSAKAAESFWSRAKPAETITLTDGTDFDIVVLAIPVGAHPYVCGELTDRRPRWQAMVDNLGTIYTQAFQVWLSKDADELNVDWRPSTVGGYLEPFDTYADMRQLIPRENWPDDE